MSFRTLSEAMSSSKMRVTPSVLHGGAITAPRAALTPQRLVVNDAECCFHVVPVTRHSESAVADACRCVGGGGRLSSCSHLRGTRNKRYELSHIHTHHK